IVKQGSRRTRALLDNAQIVEVAGELVTLAAPNALARMISEDSNTGTLRQALTKVVGGQWRVDIRPENGDVPAPGRGQPSATPDPDPRDDTDPESPSARAPAVDPESEAVRLLQDQLGAKPLEDG
ncbi:MAG TPA: hypothetical protein VGH01_01095, partial [Jatrophihabitantaceae bacterium]